MQEFKSLREAKRLVHPSIFREIHNEAVQVILNFKKDEVAVVRVLQKVDAYKVHRHAGYNSLFQYAVKSLGLSESQACDYIAVARKSVEVPALLEAMDQGQITISKARRISPVITEANQTEWLTCAQQSSKREIEKAVARVNPKAALPERSRYLTDHALELQLVVSEEVFDLLKKAQNLASQKSQVHCDLEATIKAVCETYIAKHDPVKKIDAKIGISSVLESDGFRP